MVDHAMHIHCAGGDVDGRPSTPQDATASQDAATQGPSIRERIAALSGRMRRIPHLTPEDSAALQAAFQAEDLSRVQVLLVDLFALTKCALQAETITKSCRHRHSLAKCGRHHKRIQAPDDVQHV